MRTIGEPLEVKQTPETGYQAQFSGPYVVAAALMGGSGLGLGLADFTDELARDPARRELMARVVVEADEDCDRIYPHELPCVLTVWTRDGEVLEERVLANRGGPQRPLSDEELARKFDDNARSVLDPDTATALRTAVDGLPTAASVRGLLDATAVLGSPAEDV